MKEILSYYNDQERGECERCSVSDRPSISAATNTIIPLFSQTHADTSSIRNYTGEPALSVRLLSSVDGIGLVHLAQAATLSTIEVAVRLPPPYNGKMQISQGLERSWPTDNFLSLEHDYTSI
jgi:hypothetical protein